MSLTTTGGNAMAAPLSGMTPTNMDQAVRLAEMMAKAKLVPQHLQGSPGDCLMVIEQAMRWGMSPFAVAQCASSIKGKLMFEGKLVAAAIESSGAISGLLGYEFEGEGNGRRIIVSGTRTGEATPRTVEVALKDAKTDNRMWQVQPDQQLVYHGARVWARRWTPGVILGVYSPEEMPSAPDAYAGPVITTMAEPAEVVQIDRADKLRQATAKAECELIAVTDDTALLALLARCRKLQDMLRDAEAIELDARLVSAITAAKTRLGLAGDADEAAAELAVDRLAS